MDVGWKACYVPVFMFGSLSEAKVGVRDARQRQCLRYDHLHEKPHKANQG